MIMDYYSSLGWLTGYIYILHQIIFCSNEIHLILIYGWTELDLTEKILFSLSEICCSDWFWTFKFIFIFLQYRG